MLVYGHFWRLKTISRRSENHKFSRGRFCLFGPGRARREQPNAGLHLGVRALSFGRCRMSKFFLLVYLGFFETLRRSLVAKPDLGVIILRWRVGVRVFFGGRCLYETRA